MASYINTNISSLDAQRNLASSQSALQTSLQRLSSGLRINSAKDDAAGLAIASRFTTQINGLDQAQRNANDGISLAQTGDGALSSISDNLQRIRELAVQAANSTNSASDRAAINQEVQQRLSEIDRTAAQTSFNGQNILDGTFGTASFQVGADAGQTIQVNLNSSMRTGAIGGIATLTSTGAIGATASGGTITTGAISAGDFSKVDALAGNSISPTTLHFSGTGSDQVNGANTDSTIDTSKFDLSSLAASPGFNAQTFTSTGTVTDSTGSGVDALDFSGSHLAQFDVSAASINGGAPIGVTLNSTYADSNALVTDVQNQLNAVTAGTNDFVVSYASGQLKITSSAGTSSDAVAISNVDQNAAARGLVASAGTTGVAAGAGIDFKVDGTDVALTGDYTNGGANTAQQSADAMAADIATKLGSDYTVAIDGTSGDMTITHAGTASTDTDAVAITGADAAAQSIGIANSAGTAGSLAQSSANAKFNVDGHEITLSTDYSSFDALATDLASKINTAAGTTTYSASYDSATGKLNISNSDATATGVAIAVDSSATSVEQANATAAGFVAGAGTGPSTSTALSFKVDGTAITLSGDDSGGLSAVKSDLQTQLDSAFGSGAYTVGTSGSGLTITNATNGSSAVTISNTDANAQAAGFADATGTAGAVGGSVTISNLSIKVGDNNTVNITPKTYDSVDDLASEINLSVGGAYATVSNGKLTLSSADTLTLTGSDASSLTFASTTATATSGSLDQGDTLTVDDANNLIQRVDSAMSSVNSLRSTFGAVQNRFDSVVSNLSSTSENLSAARSRIQDADFAAETASLTRGQILQQAGTAMLAQANSLPNGVLALLR